MREREREKERGERDRQRWERREGTHTIQKYLQGYLLTSLNPLASGWKDVKKMRTFYQLNFNISFLTEISKEN